MANIALSKANRIEVVESNIQHTAPAAEAVVAGDAVRLDTATGKFTKSNATSAGEARIYGIATRTVPAGMALTAIKKGVLAGYDLSALGYDADVYLSNTDGKLADAAGTTSKVVGRVIGIFSNVIGEAAGKALQIDL